MWNVIMYIWLFTMFGVMIKAMFGMFKGNLISWRDLGFLLIGMLSVGIPLIYIISQIDLILSEGILCR